MNLPTDYTNWTDQGVILQPVYNAYYPTVLYDQNGFGYESGPKFKMWFDATFLTTSIDGYNWSTPVIIAGLLGTPRHMKVLYDAAGFGGTSIKYKMWYWRSGVPNTSISALIYAESENGQTWMNAQPLTQDETKKLISGVMGTWNCGTYGPSMVIYQPDAPNASDDPWNYKYVMYFDAALSGTTYETTGLAYSVDGIHWFNYNTAAPVVDRGSGTTWDSYGSTLGTIIRDANGYHYWYSGGSTIDSSPDVNKGIGYAHSLDGKIWTKDVNNPIIHISDGPTYRNIRTYTPSIVDDQQGTMFMFYSVQGTTTGGLRHIALATLTYEYVPKQESFTQKVNEELEQQAINNEILRISNYDSTSTLSPLSAAETRKYIQDLFTNNPKDLVLTGPTEVAMSVDSTFQIDAMLYSQKGSNSTGRNVTSIAMWLTDPEITTVLTVELGKVTALVAGTVDVYAKVGDFESNRITITVA